MKARLRYGLVWACVLCVVAAVLGGACYIVWGGPASERPDRAQVAGTLLTVLALVPPVLTWAWMRRSSASTRSDPSTLQLDAAADALAARLHARWSGEVLRRGIQSPSPVRVLWTWAGGDVAVSRDELNASPPLPTDPRPLLSGAGSQDDSLVMAAGLVSQLHDELYARLRHGRLTLIGGPGAGKTGAMIWLLLEALKFRDQATPDHRAAVPVPVWLTLGQWDPQRQGLREWVTAAIASDPLLRRNVAADTVGQLLDAGRLALFLDGLDEMPEPLRHRAMERLASEAVSLRIVLTSRPEEYQVIVDRGQQLPHTAVIHLRPVGPRSAAEYLLADLAGPTREKWRTITDRIQAEPDTVLAKTLNSPLMLSLARSAYVGADPSSLMAADLNSETALRGHLLDRVLVTAYPDLRERAHAKHWLSWIAYQMTNGSGGPTRDLSWWSIPRWVPPQIIRRGARLVVGAVAVPAGLLAGAIVGSPLLGLAVGLLFVLVVTQARQREATPRVVVPRLPTRKDLRTRTGILVRPLLLGLVGGVVAGIVVGLSAGALPGVVTGLVAGPVLALMVGSSGILDGLWVQPAETVADATPVTIYREDVRAQAMSGVAGALSSMVGLGFIGGSLGMLMGGVLGGVAGGLLRGASPSVLFAELGLWTFGSHGGRRRVRFILLLETALERQVLRQAGTAYEFRHADLQDRLASAYSASAAVR